MDNRERSELIMKAIAAVVERDVDTASDAMDELGYNSDGKQMYGVCYAIASSAEKILLKLLGEQPPDALWGILNVGDQPIEAKPERAFSLRFIVAVLNRDAETSLALYDAAWQSGAEDFTKAVMTLLCDIGDLARLTLEQMGLKP